MIKDLQKAAVMRDPTMAAANIASAQSDAMRAAAANPNGAMAGFMGMGMAGGMGGMNASQLFAAGRTAAGCPAAVSGSRPRTGTRCRTCGRRMDLQLRRHQHRQKFCSECGSPAPAPAPAKVVLPQLRQRKRRQVLQQLRNHPALAPLSGNWRGSATPAFVSIGFVR